MKSAHELASVADFFPNFGKCERLGEETLCGINNFSRNVYELSSIRGSLSIFFALRMSCWVLVSLEMLLKVIVHCQESSNCQCLRQENHL